MINIVCQIAEMNQQCKDIISGFNRCHIVLKRRYINLYMCSTKHLDNRFL